MYNCKVWNKIILSVQVLFISTSELINAKIDSLLNEYFNNLNRGGQLIHLQFYFIPSKLCTAFSTFILSNLEKKFLNLKNQKAVLLDLNSNFWKFSDYLQINSTCPNPTCGKKQSNI